MGGGPVGSWWVPAPHFVLLFTVFAHIEALRVKREHQNSVPAPIFTIQNDPPETRSAQIGGSPVGSTLGAPGDPQESPRRSPDDTRNHPGSLSGNLPGNLSGNLSGSLQQSTPTSQHFRECELPIARLWRAVWYCLMRAACPSTIVISHGCRIKLVHSL